VFLPAGIIVGETMSWEVAVYYPGKKEAWLAVATLILLALLKLTGLL